MREIVGKARALRRGHYPKADGVGDRVVMPDEVFHIFKGAEKASWWVRIEDDPPAPPGDAAEPKRRGKPPKGQADDLA